MELDSAVCAAFARRLTLVCEARFKLVMQGWADADPHATRKNIMMPDREEATRISHFTYYMIRVRIDVPGEAASFAGVVERLGTGCKRAFSDGQTLLRLIADWSQLPSNMPSPQTERNDADQVGSP